MPRFLLPQNLGTKFLTLVLLIPKKESFIFWDRLSSEEDNYKLFSSDNSSKKAAK